MGKDLIGMTFERWTVIGKAAHHIDNKGRKFPFWLCKCSCSACTIREVSQNSLTQGKSKSCGCLQKEVAAITIVKARKKYNPFVVNDKYVILYTFKNEPFLVDIEDFGRIHKYCWHKNDNGYLVTTINHTTVYLHRMIMRAPKNIDVDHKHGSNTKHDNRKSNLRLATVSQNGMNKDIQSNNTSGHVGVGWSKKFQKWEAKIQIDGKSKHLGMFANIEDAVKARKKAEDYYFGEFSFDNSREGCNNNGVSECR